jgi:hypothetical protein
MTSITIEELLKELNKVSKRENGLFTVSEYAGKMGLPKTTARIQIRKLFDNGKIEFAKRVPMQAMNGNIVHVPAYRIRR